MKIWDAVDITDQYQRFKMRDGMRFVELSEHQAELTRLRAERDSLRLERDAAEHNRVKGNEHLIARAETAERALDDWRSWAQFVWLNGGPVTLDDKALQKAVCQKADEPQLAYTALLIDLRALLDEDPSEPLYNRLAARLSREPHQDDK